ncbi:MAG: FxDxF family PEP-CTERM protein [Aquabacterium sp.]
MKFKLAALVAASTLAFNAQAVTIDWGSHDPLETAVGMFRTGVFSDTFLFTLTDGASLFNTSVSNNNAPVLALTDGLVQLFRETGPVDTLVDSFVFTGSTGVSSHAFGALAGGAYYYMVSGNGSGTQGGLYNLTSIMTPAVPEPQTYAMLLAGLGAVGFLVRRRRPQA